MERVRTPPGERCHPFLYMDLVGRRFVSCGEAVKLMTVMRLSA